MSHGNVFVASYIKNSIHYQLALEEMGVDCYHHGHHYVSNPEKYMLFKLKYGSLLESGITSEGLLAQYDWLKEFEKTVNNKE